MNLKPIMRLLCHQKEERTYKVCSSYLLVCARCLGIYVGFLFSFLILIFLYRFFTVTANVLYAFALLIPMAADGLTQAFGWRESKNFIRFITGYLAGLGTAYIFYAILCVIFAKQLPVSLPSYELIPALALMFAFLTILEKFSGSKNILPRKFFNTIAVFSAVVLFLGVFAFYVLLLMKRLLLI